MNEVLGAVNDFILKYVGNNEVPALSQDQIVIGWQNAVSALPPHCQEYAVLTLLRTIRHGTNVHMRVPAEGAQGFIETVASMAEHAVQVDFCSARPQQGEEVARIRAEICGFLHRDRVATEFYAPYHISSCYADDLVPLPFLNESEQWVARYSVTLHLSGWTATNIELDSFDELDLRVEDVDVHHACKPVPKKENEYASELLNDVNDGYIFTRIYPKIKNVDVPSDDGGENIQGD